MSSLPGTWWFAAASESGVMPGPAEHLGPRRKIGLSPFLFHDETCHRGRENSAATKIEPSGQTRVKPRAIGVSGAGHIDDFAGANPRNSDATVTRVNDAAARTQRDHDDLGGS